MDTVVNNTQVIGNYRLVSVIGKGSFAVVYKGEKVDKGKEKEKDKEKGVKKAINSEKLDINNNDSSKLNEKVKKDSKDEVFTMPDVIAIKSIIKERLNKKLTVNLRLEINILLKIRHQHIVQLYGIESSEKTINLLMEYCANGDLSLYMKKHFSNKENNPLIGPWKGFNEYIVLEFLFQLASALQYMNEKSVVHRDLKPQNILLTFDPNRRLHPIPRPTYSSPNSYCLVPLPYLKLADFGFARSLQPTNLASTLCGSPLYMAPEILDGKTYSANVDLWSLGTILYELVMSRTPYRAMNHLELLKKIKTSTGIHFPGERTKSQSHDKNESNNDKSNEEFDAKICDCNNDIPQMMIEKDEKIKGIISDTSDNDVNTMVNDILNINKDNHEKEKQISNDSSLSEMNKYSKDPNAFCTPLKELIRNLLKQKSDERITFQDFFDIVDYQLKPHWELYRKRFEEVLKEKESNTTELNNEYNEDNLKNIHFIPIDDTKISKLSPTTSSHKNTTVTNTNSQKTEYIEEISSPKNREAESSFDDSNYQIIQADNIYSDGKGNLQEEEISEKVISPRSAVSSVPKPTNELILPNSKQLNTKNSNKSITFEAPEKEYINTEKNQQKSNNNNNNNSKELFDFRSGEVPAFNPYPYHKRFYSYPDYIDSIQYLEDYHKQQQQTRRDKFNPTFPSIPSDSSGPHSPNSQSNTSNDSENNSNNSNVDSFNTNVMKKISIQWDPSQYNHIFENNKLHKNSFTSTTFQFQKYSPYYKNRWRRTSQPHLLNCHSFPEKHHSFTEKPNIQKNNVLNNTLTPLSKINSNEQLSQLNLKNSPFSFINKDTNNTTINNNNNVNNNNFNNNINNNNSTIINNNIHTIENNNNNLNYNENHPYQPSQQKEPQPQPQTSLQMDSQIAQYSLMFKFKTSPEMISESLPNQDQTSNYRFNTNSSSSANNNRINNAVNTNPTSTNTMSQNLDERFSHLTLKGDDKITRSKNKNSLLLSRSKSSSLEKILEGRNNTFTTINTATTGTANTLDNEITERNEDSPFQFINSMENRSRSFSSSTSSSNTILERISLKNLNGGISRSRSRSNLNNTLDNNPKFATPVGSAKETHESSYSQKPFLMTQLTQVPDIFNAPQMDFVEMAPFPELFRSSSNRSSISKSRRVHHSNSCVFSNHSGSIRSNGSSSNSLLNRSNSLNNNSYCMGSCSSSGSMVNIVHTNSVHGGNNNKSYSSGSINLIGNNSSRSNLYINTLANRSNHSGASLGSFVNSPFTQEKFNGMLFNSNNKHQSYLKAKASSPSVDTRKIRKSYSTNFIQDNPTIDSRNAPSPPFIFSEIKKPSSMGDINKEEPSLFNNYTPHQTDKFLKMNDLTIREEGYIIVDENAVKLNCYVDDLSTKDIEDVEARKNKNILKIDLQTFTHNPKIIHPFNQKVSNISICAYSIQLIAEKYTSSDTTTAVTLYLKALSLYQHSINIAKSLSASIYEQLGTDARHELYILIQWVRDQYNECLDLVSDLYIDENKDCEIVEDIIWNEALLLAIQTEQQEKMGINLKQCEKAYLQSIYYLKSLLINSQDIRDVSINIPYSVQITDRKSVV